MLQCQCGAALNALLVLVQIIDAMWKPSAYDWVYPLSYLFTFTVATPHSILVQLAYPEKNLKQGEPLCGHSAALEHEAAQSPHTGVLATKHFAVDFGDVQANWVPLRRSCYYALLSKALLEITGHLVLCSDGMQLVLHVERA